MSKRKIYVVGGSIGYANWMEGELVDRMEDADLVMFTGGEDVSPSLYGAKSHYTTSSNWSRDVYEVTQFNKARELELPMICICRGCQFLITRATNGSLVQHSQHPYIHPIKTNDGRTFLVNSLHHQQGYIKDIPPDEIELLAWAEKLSPFHLGEDDDDELDVEKEVEIAYLPKLRAICIQSHPEMLSGYEDWHVEFINYCRELVDKYLS